jgi:hypothetical protein
MTGLAKPETAYPAGLIGLGERAAIVCESLIYGGPQDEELRDTATRLRLVRITNVADVLSRFSLPVVLQARAADIAAAVGVDADVDQLTAAYRTIRDCSLVQ